MVRLVFAGFVLGVLSASPARADDRAECLAAASDAQDLLRDKHLVLAREKLLVCAREVCPQVVRKDCATWAVDLEPTIPTLVVTAKDTAGSDVIDARLFIDDAPISEQLHGKAMPIDPGVHQIRIHVEGAEPVQQQVVVREGEKARVVELTVTRRAAPAPEPITEPKPVVAPPSPIAPPPAEVTTEEPRSLMRDPEFKIGVAAAGLGVVGVAVGTVFGVKAMSAWSDAKDLCGGGCLPGSDAYARREDARRAGTVSTVSFIAGGVGIAVGVGLVLHARSKHARAVATALVHAATTGGIAFGTEF